MSAQSFNMESVQKLGTIREKFLEAQKVMKISVNNCVELAKETGVKRYIDSATAMEQTTPLLYNDAVNEVCEAFENIENYYKKLDAALN